MLMDRVTTTMAAATQATVTMAATRLRITTGITTAGTPLRTTVDTPRATPRPITVLGTVVLSVPHSHITAARVGIIGGTGDLRRRAQRTIRWKGRRENLRPFLSHDLTEISRQASIFADVPRHRSPAGLAAARPVARVRVRVTETGTTQRILPHVIVQNFVIGAGGELELATAGSTRPITSRVSHAGIGTTTVYELTEPTIPPDPAIRIAP